MMVWLMTIACVSGVGAPGSSGDCSRARRSGGRSWRNVQRNRAELARALAVEALRALCRPLERHAHDFAAAAFACGFDYEPIFTGSERGERRFVAREFQLLN